MHAHITPPPLLPQHVGRDAWAWGRAALKGRLASDLRATAWHPGEVEVGEQRGMRGMAPAAGRRSRGWGIVSPLEVQWNTRNRFKVRQHLESEKAHGQGGGFVGFRVAPLQGVGILPQVATSVTAACLPPLASDILCMCNLVALLVAMLPRMMTWCGANGALVLQAAAGVAHRRQKGLRVLFQSRLRGALAVHVCRIRRAHRLSLRSACVAFIVVLWAVFDIDVLSVAWVPPHHAEVAVLPTSLLRCT